MRYLRISAEAYRELIQGRRRGLGATLGRAGLWILSIGYGAGVRIRNACYDLKWTKIHEVSVPVVSVGNLTLGGTGKTPCVEYISKLYRNRDLRVAILSRGYGQESGPNDEALVLEECLPDVPHLQGANRVELARTALAELESEVLILDDGFQHRRLARVLDVVLVDATDPWGSGHIFPRGLLREPANSLGRAGAVILTRCDQVPAETLAKLRHSVERLAPRAVLAESRHGPVHLIDADGRMEGLELLRGTPVAAFAGIGNPNAFRRTLEDSGARITDFRSYPDHHPYNRQDVEQLRSWAEDIAKDCVLVTTQKDLVKLRLAKLSGRALWALRVGLQVEAGRDELDQALLKAVQRTA